MLGNLIGGFITIIVGTALMPTVADQIKSAQNLNSSNATATTNLSSTTSTIVGLVPLFYALGIMSTGVAIAINGLRDAGIM